MPNTLDLATAIFEEAQQSGNPITMEQAAQLAVGHSMESRSESRVDGAPDTEISDSMGESLGLTPSGYMGDLATASEQAASEGTTYRQPGTEAFGTEGDLLTYDPRMTADEYDAAKANRRHRQRLLRGMAPDPGGYQAFNPQQPMWLGTADDQAEWQRFLEENPEAQRRYDPASYEAERAAEEQAAANAHAARLEERYGPDAAAAYLESQRTGKPMDMNMVRTGGERKDIEERRYNELSARSGGSSGADARRLLEEQDERSGYSGAMGGSRVSGKWAVGDGPDGKPEAKYQRFSRKTKERQAELDARKLALRNQRMLAGDNPANNMANAYTLMGDPFNDGLTENQRRALEYMLPSGRLAAEVDARNLESAAGMATSALQRSLGPLVTAAAGGAEGNSQLGVGDKAYEQVQQGNLTHPSVIEYARQYHGTLWSFPGRDKVQKTVDYLLLTLPGMDEPTARRIAESF
jgi:hypothetical protein